jgi:hypothetical protein
MLRRCHIGHLVYYRVLSHPKLNGWRAKLYILGAAYLQRKELPPYRGLSALRRVPKISERRATQFESSIDQSSESSCFHMNHTVLIL